MTVVTMISSSVSKKRVQIAGGSSEEEKIYCLLKTDCRKGCSSKRLDCLRDHLMTRSFIEEIDRWKGYWLWRSFVKVISCRRDPCRKVSPENTEGIERI
jgi:hypothetical protein